MDWTQLVLRAIVPISFVAIWALTALFNKESQGFPARPPGSPLSGPGPGPRPGDPTVRWGPSEGIPSNMVRRVPLGDDDILIIPNDPSRPTRVAPSRPNPGNGGRRPAKARPASTQAKKAEPTATRPRLAGVSQNVNQSLARPIELTPLMTIAPMTTTTDLANAPSAPSKTSAIVTVSTLRPLMSDPVRLREAFIVNELFQPPVSMRGRRGHHG